MQPMKATSTNNILLCVQTATRYRPLPRRQDFRRWVTATLEPHCQTAELVIRLVDSVESAALNQKYRNKAGPTNSLSFPFEPPPGITTPLLGDLVLCPALLAEEATQQGKSLETHWAHLIVHGCLHLLGYDHLCSEEAEVMERLEVQTLAQLGYPDPYTF
jgi:probable rRNA maturation factor